MRTSITLLFALSFLPFSAQALYQSSFLFCIVPDADTPEAIVRKLPLATSEATQLAADSTEASQASNLLQATLDAPDLEATFGTFDDSSLLNVESLGTELEDFSSLSTLSLDQE